MDETPVLVPGAHRVIRMLDERDSAYAGELVTDGEGRAVRLDAENLSDDLWAFAGAEHVAGPRDLLRRTDGADALLPWCETRVDAFLGRRSAANTPLSSGETVTLVGSLLRGIVEVGDRPLTGHWWLSDETRPLFAPGDGSSCADSAVTLIERLRADGSDRAMGRLLGEIAGAARDPREVRRSIDRWERELTELAAPRPLERDVPALTPLSATVPLSPGAERSPGVVGDPDAPAPRLAVLGRLRGALIRTLRRFWQIGSVWRWRRGPARQARAAADGKTSPRVRGGRGRMLAVGGAAAAAVLVGGLMWPPADDDSAASESTAGRSATATRSSDAEAGTRPSPRAEAEGRAGAAAESRPDAVEDASIESVAVALLAAVAVCVRDGDEVCGHAVAAGAGALVLDRLAGADAKRAVTGVEDYGDVSVLRLGPSGERLEQMLVLVAHEDGWLVRDVYDVADQPSGQG